MAIISNVRNDGNSAVTTGPKKVNSLNVAPYTIIAVASPNGRVLTAVDIANYDWFNAAQTSAATDQIILSEAVDSKGNPQLPIGTIIDFYCVSSCKVLGQGTNTINGGTNVQGITMAAGSSYEFLKTTATTWVCSAQSAAGAYSAPIAA